MATRRITLFAGLLSVAMGLGHPGDAAASPHAGVETDVRLTHPANKPPTLSAARYDEHWEALADPSNRKGRWTEAFKYRPLSDIPGGYMTTGLELRVRYEAYRSDLLGHPQSADAAYLWKRALPYVDVHAAAARVFVQPILAYASGPDAVIGPTDRTGVDLLQGFADLDFTPRPDTGLRLRAGREVMSLGSERLVGTRYGPNVLLAFDGLRALIDHRDWHIDLFDLAPVEPQAGNFDDRRSGTRALRGAYLTRREDDVGFDVYLLDYRNDTAEFQDATGRERRHTLGVRQFGRTGRMHWNLEAMYQGGSVGASRIRAWSLASEVGRAMNADARPAYLMIRADVASGDHSPGDGVLGTFNAMFPKGKYFGELSPLGPYNIVNLQPSLSLPLSNSMTVGALCTAYWRQSRTDGVYDMPGHLLGNGGDSTARYIGSEFEITADWQFSPELALSASLSRFLPGRFLHESGVSRPIHMLGLEANFRF